MRSALPPSITNRIACSGSRPRSTRSASSVRASVAFSVEPSHSPSGILTPSVRDAERDDVRALGDLQAVEHHHRQAHVVQPPDISSPSAVRVRSMNISDTVDFDVDEAAASTSAADRLADPRRTCGSRRRRASGPSPPASADRGRRSTRTSRPAARARRRPCASAGRRTATRRPPSVIDPSSWP